MFSVFDIRYTHVLKSKASKKMVLHQSHPLKLLLELFIEEEEKYGLASKDRKALILNVPINILTSEDRDPTF